MSISPLSPWTSMDLRSFVDTSLWHLPCNMLYTLMICPRKLLCLGVGLSRARNLSGYGLPHICGTICVLLCGPQADRAYSKFVLTIDMCSSVKVTTPRNINDLLIHPAVMFTFLILFSIWLLNDSFLSISTPRSYSHCEQ